MNSGEACACDNWICPHNEEKIAHLPGVVKGVAWLKGRVEEMRKYWQEAEASLAAERAKVAETVDLLAQCAFNHSEKRLDGSQGAMAARSLVLDFLSRLHGFPRADDGQARAERRAEAAETKVADQSNVIIELGAKLNATKLREEGLEKDLGRAREALRVFKRYGKHRGSCVQVTGKPCSCGFDDAATKTGGIAAPEAP